MTNPSIRELQNKEHFKLIAELDHKQIKEFVITQLSEGGWVVKTYMVYQLAMLALGFFILTRAIILAFQNNAVPFYYILAAFVFCFSLLIIIHELLHGIAIKLTGAPKVNYGAYLRKFIFYAEADQHVLNKKQFAFIALAPFIVIKIITVFGSILFFNEPVVFSFVFVMFAHSFFCAGDIGLLSLFYQYKNTDIFTFDLRKEKKSFYYKKL